jgi:two-component system response regulator RegX3
MSDVLFADDELTIREAVAYALRVEGVKVRTYETGTGALDAARDRSFDLVILDVMLPDISGLEVCRRLRTSSGVPVLLLTARDTEADLVLGFEAGADDYIKKPFSMTELVIRVRAMLRRQELDRSIGQRIVSVGDLSIDLARHEVRVNGEHVRLTPTEVRLLTLLASDDRAYSRREILEHVWETMFVPDERSCDVHVANLRRKIEDDPAHPKRVLTVRGVGYRLGGEDFFTEPVATVLRLLVSVGHMVTAQAIPEAAPAQHHERPILIFFTSDTNGRCRRAQGFLAQVLQRRHNHETFSLRFVDQDDRPDLIDRFKVEKTPTLMVVSDKVVRGKLVEPRGCEEIQAFLAPWLH